ncbi:hypothetical protein [Actinomadura sp. 7K534]|uniref:allene oxide cyclase barrel-like domain-containing protein n=1 Tax=Actinomadura sp. 7K534 TaxID=2530366 RepID=UPI001050F336|nr:hypothetical protein [Actinomadura sp. 7K534]TDB93472.1 hypothetical protein E1266_20270 [Actinomadura sp. 7K534]
MGMTSLRPGLAVSLAAALGDDPGGVFAAIGAGTGAVAPDDECIRFEELGYSVSERSYRESEPAVGDVATAGGEFFDSAGNVIARDSGRMQIVHHDPATEHWVAFTRVSYEFEDGGTARSMGFVDLNDQLTGSRVEIYIVGTGGRYLGKVGTLSWVIESTMSAKARMVLCARPLEKCCDTGFSSISFG